MSALPPAGWYPDHLDPRQLRWWNGQAWTEHIELFRQPATEGAAVNRMRDVPLVTTAEALRAAAGFGPAK